MKNFEKLTHTLLYMLLFSPLLAVVFKNVFFPKNIIFYFQLLFFFYGILYFFILYVNRVRIKLSVEVYFLLAYILYLLFWSFFSGELQRRGINIIVNNVQLSTFFILVIIKNTNFNDNFIKTTLFIIKITILVALIVSITQVVVPNFMKATIYNNFNVGNSTIYSIRRASIFNYAPNELGYTFIPLAAIFLGVNLFLKKKNTIFYLIVSGIVAVLTNFRYIILGYLTLSFQIGIDKQFKFRSVIKYIVSISILIIIGYQLLGSFGYNFSDWYYSRLFAEGSIEETTRYKAIENFLVFFPDYMWFGTGVGMTDEIEAASNAIGSSQIHVGYLAHLVYWGLVGSIMLFGFWFQVILRFYKNAKKTNYWGSFFAFLTFLLANATLVHFSIFHYGLIFAFVFDKYFQDKYKYLKVVK